jgi:serine O-acetyltransferase
VLRDVPSDCTVVGVPGRIVYRSGVRVNPLEHGSLPDSEATVIRALVDRIEALEQQVQDLIEQPSSTMPHLQAVSSKIDSPDAAEQFAKSCHISDQVIQQFLDGAGI